MFLLLTGLLQSSNQDELLGNECCINGDGLNNLIAISEKSMGPNIRIPSPGNPSAYFAPISPAAKTSSDIEQLTDSTSSKNPLMEILRGRGSSDDGRDSEGNKIEAVWCTRSLQISYFTLISD